MVEARVEEAMLCVCESCLITLGWEGVLSLVVKGLSIFCVHHEKYSSTRIDREVYFSFISFARAFLFCFLSRLSSSEYSTRESRKKENQRRMASSLLPENSFSFL